MRPAIIVISSLLVLFLSACVAPGSSMGRIAVSGQLIDPSGQAVADEEVQIVLPATYGLGGLDLVLNEPSDFGRAVIFPHDSGHGVKRPSRTASVFDSR